MHYFAIEISLFLFGSKFFLDHSYYNFMMCYCVFLGQILVIPSSSTSFHVRPLDCVNVQRNMDFFFLSHCLDWLICFCPLIFFLLLYWCIIIIIVNILSFLLLSCFIIHYITYLSLTKNKNKTQNKQTKKKQQQKKP